MVADNGLGSVLIFETSGKLLRTIGSRGQGRGQFKDISAVTVAPSGDILVADSRIQVFNPAGEFLREIFPQVCKIHFETFLLLDRIDVTSILRRILQIQILSSSI